MPRKKCYRHIEGLPDATFYKPAGIPLRELGQVVIHLDEYEALRLADGEGLYHEDAAEKMGVSRQTFGRIIGSARQKIAVALTTGKAIKIENYVHNSNHNITDTQHENSDSIKGQQG